MRTQRRIFKDFESRLQKKILVILAQLYNFQTVFLFHFVHLHRFLEK
jgi:hypothetical protein